MNRLLLVVLALAVASCSKKPETEYAQNPAAEQAADKSGAQAAAISPEAAKAADIEVLQAGPAEIRETLTLYGVIKPNAERQQTVRARYPGTVRTIEKHPGDKVKRGETLLTIESNDSLEPYALHSPISGSVLERNVNPGETVDASTTLIAIADLSSVWAEFAVFARDLGRVRAGMPVGIRAGETDVVGEAKLAYVAPAGHADSQSVVARAVLNNSAGQWVAGQFVTGEVVVSNVQAAVVVAASALQNMKDGPTVFVQTGAGFVPRPVEIGHRGRDAMEILKGVAAGEKYAGKNSYLIKADLLKTEVEE